MPDRRPTADRSVRDLFEGLVVILLALSSVVHVEPAPFDLLIVLLFVIALALRRLAIPRASSFALACVAMFLLTNVISLGAADNINVALRYGAITLYLVIAWAFVLGLAGKSRERAVQLVMLGWTIGAVLTTILAILGYFRLLPIYELVTESDRIRGLFKDPNVYGAALVPPAVWAASRLVALERSRRSAWAAALVLCGVGVFLSYSRGAWISLGVAMLTFFLLRVVGVGTGRSRVMTLLAVPVAAVLLAIAFGRLTDIDVVRDMLERRLGMQSYDTERFSIQRKAIETAMRTPLGIGPGHTEPVFRRAAHNSYVRAFVENGYLGGLSLIGLLVASLLRSTWLALGVREPRLQVAMAMVAASLAAICVESVVIDTLHWRHMWVLAALAWIPAPEGDYGATSSSTRSPS